MIWLVGAGCGSPRWLTLEATKILGQADAVVYDRLIHPDALLLAPRSALFLQAGKRGGDHTMGQDEINCLLVQLGKAHHTVVRLKGGDPFTFGRGGEEAMSLRENGLAWRAIPGITAAMGGFLAEGVPLTHRGISSGLCLATGQLGSASDPQGYMEGLAGFRGSRVLYMSASNLEENLKKLSSLGLSSNTPCAILTWGGWGRSSMDRTTLGGAMERARSKVVKSPSVILLGEAALLDLSPQKGPLTGVQVAVCRPMPEGYDTSRFLEDLGADAFTIPLLEERVCALADQVSHLIRRCRWLVFTSPRGPRALKRLIKDLRGINCSTVALGAGTARAMEEIGIGVDLVPPGWDSRSLAKLLEERIGPGDEVLFLRNRRGSDLPVQAVKAAGGVPVVVPLYEMIRRDLPWWDLIKEHWEEYPPNFVAFGSSAMAEEWAQQVGGLPEGAMAVAWGDECHRTCARLFGGAIRMGRPDLHGLKEALLSNLPRRQIIG